MASDYIKKPHVFRLKYVVYTLNYNYRYSGNISKTSAVKFFPNYYNFRLANGGEYLFQTTSEEEMAQWINAINQVAIQDEGAAGGAGRS